jgi:hypothetical protein
MDFTECKRRKEPIFIDWFVTQCSNVVTTQKIITQIFLLAKTSSLNLYLHLSCVCPACPVYYMRTSEVRREKVAATPYLPQLRKLSKCLLSARFTAVLLCILPHN